MEDLFPTELKIEELRIKKTYAERDRLNKTVLYSWHRADAAYAAYRQKSTWAKAIKESGIEHLADLEILDVGSGSGGWLRMIIEWGASPDRLHGVDLLKDRIEKAKSISANGVDFRISNGWPLPYTDFSMNLCTASTVFSSILEEEARQILAQEMARVTKAKGWVMVFDYAVSDPRNPDTIGIGRREIKKLFHELELIKTYKLILAPPLLRRFPQWLLWVAYALETFFPFLCTHRLYVLKK